MSSERSHNINLESEKSSDKMSEKMSEFIKSPIGKFAVGMLVFIVVGAGVAAEKYFNRDKADNEIANTPPKQEQQITTPVNETFVKPSNSGASTEQINTPGTNEALPTVESLEINAELFSKPEELVKTFENNMMTSWFNAGATPENAKAAIESDDILSYAKKIASEYDPIYEEALITDSQESNPSIEKQIKRIKEIHLSTLYGYYLTSRPNMHPEDKEPYRHGIEVTEIVSLKKYELNDKQITIKVIEHDYDNADKNRMSTEQFGNAGVSEEDYSPELTFRLEKNKVKLYSVKFDRS